MANRYWVGGTGNWSDTAHWSSSSGGAGGETVPASSDNVYFDANSFSGASQTVTIDATANCLDMDWTGVTNNPTLSSSVTHNHYIYGNLTLVSGMLLSGTRAGSFVFKSTSVGKTITTAGKTCYMLSFEGAGGGWTLQDNVTLSRNFAVYHGAVDTNSKSINCVGFFVNGVGTRTLTLGSSVVTISDDAVFTSTGLTLNADTSKIIMTGNNRTFTGGGLTYYNLELQGTPITIAGSNTFNDLKGTAGKSIVVTQSTTQTVTTLTLVGTLGNPISISSSGAGSAVDATISCAIGTIDLEYCSIEYMEFTGGATFKALYSTDEGGNTGILFVHMYFSSSISMESTVTGTIVQAISMSASIDMESVVAGLFMQLIAFSASISMTSYVTGKIIKKLSSVTNGAVSSFVFSDKLYILDGSEYRVYNGSTISTVTGYRPVLYTATPPAGGGTENEGINVLTGAKSQYFSGNNSATIYQLCETAITSVDAVRVGGVTKATPADYSVNLTNGTVTFGVAPATGVNNVEIDWTKGSGSRTVVTANKYANLYGGQNDSRVFLYGDGTNEVVWSGLADGVISAEYFPEDNSALIGSTDSPITYIDTQYDRQIIYTKNGAFYSSIEEDATLGTIFPIYPLNDSIGNEPYGQGKLIQNNPITFFNGIYEWVATSVRDERNAKYISERIQAELEAIDLSSIITHDYKKQGELWIVTGTTAYIYNYRRDVWYKFTFPDTIKSFYEVDGDLYFGTSTGSLMKFTTEAMTDNGTKISDLLETGDIDFGQNWKRKFLNFGYVGLLPEGKSKANIGWVTDYATSSDDEEIEYNNIDLGNIDFGDFTFTADYNSKPFRIKLKAKKFTYLKLVITCNSANHNMTLLNISLPAIVGGVSK